MLVRPGGQVEHHLFPQVPRHRLAAVHAEVVRFCRDEGVAFHEAGVVDGTFEASPAPSAMAPVARARGGGKQAAESTRRGAGGRVRSYIGGGDMMRGDGSRGGGGGGGRFCGTCRRWRSSSSATSRASSPRRASRWHSPRPPRPRILCRAVRTAPRPRLAALFGSLFLFAAKRVRDGWRLLCGGEGSAAPVAAGCNQCGGVRRP